MITLLKPIGHCFGVIKAIEIAKEAKHKHQDKNVYVFGLLVHNEEVVKELDKIGVKTIEFNQDNASEKLKQFDKNDVVIFTAHGHPLEYETICSSILAFLINSDGTHKHLIEPLYTSLLISSLTIEAKPSSVP